MTGRFAVKRLVAVEIRPEKSHQHEFHAGQLRRELGFDAETTHGVIRFLIYLDDESEPVLDESQYTLYDARADNPSRSEWHLYYTSRQLSAHVRPGDLLVLYRPSEGRDLHGVVTRAGSRREERLLDALMLRDRSVLREFRFVDPGDATGAASQEIATALAAGGDIEEVAVGAYPVSAHPLLHRAIAEQALPLTREMAEAAQEFVVGQLAETDPDQHLARALEAETQLFITIEEALNRERLERLRSEKAPLRVVLDWAMGVHQARRSRRGQSLQRHFQKILELRHVPFSPQCTTEPGETPDFVVPGCDAYHEPTYPSDRLRMVACKSTSKERWRQVLNEAERIPEKYLLTLDQGLTSQVVRQMRAARLRPFLPRSVVDTAYSALPEREELGTVAMLLDELDRAVG